MDLSSIVFPKNKTQTNNPTFNFGDYRIHADPYSLFCTEITSSSEKLTLESKIIQVIKNAIFIKIYLAKNPKILMDDNEFDGYQSMEKGIQNCYLLVISNDDMDSSYDNFNKMYEKLIENELI